VAVLGPSPADEPNQHKSNKSHGKSDRRNFLTTCSIPTSAGDNLITLASHKIPRRLESQDPFLNGGTLD
jgi:hypothetical protein